MLETVLAGALRFRMLLVAVALGVIVLGALSLRTMPSDVLPELASGPVLEVQTEALGPLEPGGGAVRHRARSRTTFSTVSWTCGTFAHSRSPASRRSTCTSSPVPRRSMPGSWSRSG